MTESTARAERFDVQAAASPLYLWEVPQKPVSVRIPFSLIDRLEREAVENFRSLTSRGSEIGGLLVGDVSPGSPMVVSITDYDLIPCDYSRGPLYRLSDADMGRFEQAIQQRLAAGRGVAGFFRSHTRKGISLDADDLTFFQARFRDPHQIALLVRPFATKASTAGIFIWENGKVNGEASCLEFAFRSSELGPGLPPAPPEPKAAAPAAPPPQAPKSSMRAQIVPIASRREVAQVPAPVAEPAPPPAPVVPPPAPTPAAIVTPPRQAPTPGAIVTPPRPAVEEKTTVVPDKSAKIEKPGKSDRYDKYDKYDKAEKDKTDKNVKTAKIEPPAAKIAPPPAKAEKAPPPAVVAPEIEAPARSGKGVKLLLAAVASIALFVGLFVYPGFLRNNSKAPVAVHPDSNQLQLRVERANGELMLTWNPDAEIIKNASKAALSIADGDQKENVDMDLAELAKGKIMYSPSGTDIRFEMRVTDKAGKVTTEPVRMLRPPSPLQEQNSATAKTSNPAGTKPVAGAVPPGATPNPTADQPPVEQPAKPAPAPLKQFKTESLAQRLRPAEPTDMADAPTVSAGARPNASAIPGVNMNALAPAAPAAPSAPSASSPSPKSGGQIQAAVLIYRKDAEYPKIAKQTGAKGTVTLNATIGADGNIKKVKVVSGHPMLTNAAVEAVKQWRYRPTLLNGQPVETETQVLVNFVGDR
jgi:protein TonB